MPVAIVHAGTSLVTMAQRAKGEGYQGERINSNILIPAFYQV
jgi:hypothetical protein